MSWAVTIHYARDAVTCPWEVWERLPDGRMRLLGAYQTSHEAIERAKR